MTPITGTFFQDLPTPRQYARFPFYNMMNNEDLNATFQREADLKAGGAERSSDAPAGQFVGSLYSGGGAFQPNTFGFTSRPSNTNRGLADVYTKYQFTRSFAATLYYGHAWGKGVIASIYPNDSNGQLIFLETNFHF
jgi:hypothetical protein